ncbi:zinc finger protein Rlf isoform A [Alligator mississippiensis]|uniref:Zinc finger protein Rlf isoform A n=1 Tax=Alligator mississippiensis TaxID=8496 RepID=A0A151PG57_ALLMI|nr:zinc finger protein Rlf isoform A [Alligator mississippiensis]
MPRLVAALRARLWQLQVELREQEVSEASSRAYCRGFCQTLLQYAGTRGASEHILPFLEVYRISIQSFANARPYLTTECEDVLLVLGRLVLSCFELLLSIPESELPREVWLGFHQSMRESHDALLEFGNNNLQILVDITKEGVWKNPVLLKILSQQPVDAEEGNKLITREGPSFLQMRIKHLMKSNCIPQATALSKLCADSPEIPNASSFRQAYITCVCSMLPNEDSIKEIAKVDCKEVLDIICNLESEGQDNTAFILCTTYLTHQLQTANVYCSWELTLFWSKLQKRIDPSLDSFLERCRQFGIIAKTLQHLFFLIRVIQSEAEEAGLAVSILLCVRALQIRSNGNDEMKTSVCKTIACLLPDDLEVRRACQLTEFLLEPTFSGFSVLEELYLQPDQKFDEENAPVPNSLRCELLLALKAYWPFDPEFWDWKTLKRHCLKLLGREASDSEDDASCLDLSLNETDLFETFLSDCDETREHKYYEGRDATGLSKDKARVKKPIGSSERHREYYNRLFGNRKEEQDNLLKDDNNEQDYLTDHYEENKNERQVKDKSKKALKNKEKHPIIFKTREEALQMCKEKADQNQYPCIVKGCLSVVKLESSIVRHYKRTHQLTSNYIEQQFEKLVVCVKCGTMIKNESRSETEVCLSQEEMRDFKQENPADTEINWKEDEEAVKPLVPDSDYDHPDTDKENQNSCSATSEGFDTEAFLYSDTLKYDHSSKPSFEEDSITEPPLCKTEGLSENNGRENGEYFTNLQLELPREKVTEDWHHCSIHQNSKRNSFCTRDKFQKHSLPKPFDLKSFKPMGFESSFLKFIQESQEREDDDDDFDELVEWESPESFQMDGDLESERDCQRDEAVNSLGSERDPEVSIPQNNHSELTEIQPLISESPSAPSLDNLRAILDKALTDCGDLALKQLHYLRPVVVLERSKFSTPLIDLFPTKKTDELCVGST